jgi:RNA polymerase sigma-54 factor
MTPQLMQAIKLLQMSNLELESAIRDELERNPLLEIGEAAGDAGEDGAAGGAGAGAGAEPHDGAAEAAGDRDDVRELPAGLAEEAAAFDRGGDATVDPDAQLDRGFALDSRDGGGAHAATGAGSGRDDLPGIEAIAATALHPPTLRDHIEAQLAGSRLDAVDRAIAAYLIGNVDAAGYLRVSPAEAAAALGVAEARVDDVLAVLRQLEPAGLFATGLKDCLKLQLAARNRLDPAIAKVLDNLDLLARRDFSRLRKLCRVDEEDMAAIVREIRALDPKPGLVFDTSHVQAIAPDVLVRRSADGDFLVELNTATLPRLLIDRQYFARISARTRSAEERAFLSERLQSANWLVKSLDQRAQTILKVASAIVEHQAEFFTHGVERIRPLTLKAVADRIGMHESTVSRVTANKYLACPRGMFELKYFFSVGLATADGGDAVSAEAVRHRIRALIEKETAHTVCSDDFIAQTLNSAGIDLARRTVANYREAMQIPSSVQRRRDKAAATV